MLNTLKYFYQIMYYRLHVNALRKIPVLVYQMGKVGSSSVSYSLKRNGCHPVFHIHRMNPKNIEKVAREHISLSGKAQDERFGLFLDREIFHRNRPVKIISMVRDPISRNISAFFQNFELFVGENYKPFIDMDALISRFIEEYNHQVPLDWFDDELKAVSGIDVYQHSFPKEEGVLEIKTQDCAVLIFKVEIEDMQKEAAISRFIGLNGIRLRNTNVGAQKNYAETYVQFKKKICLPESYVERMTRSRMMTHFYSEFEIEKIRHKWTGKDDK